ncbi:MAG: pyridoxamine 5'-phosphate oxidase family protein [Promethearchaeota archaeon]
MEYAKISPFFDGVPLIYLANSVENRPHVRAVSLIQHREQLWVCSGSHRPKYEQLKKNNRIEFTLVARVDNEFHNIRASGKAIEIKDPETRSELAEAIPFFKGYWTTPDDPNFVLYHLKISKIEYHPPGGKEYFIMDNGAGTSIRFEKNYRKK